MKRLGVVLVSLMLLALACGETSDSQTPVLSAPESTAQALASNAASAEQPGNSLDIEATITARVQATVQALFDATPIPSPTPTQGFLTPTRTPEPTSFTIQTGGSFNTVPAPTPTPVITATPSPTTTRTPIQQGDCFPAADGVRVTAWINGAKIASAIVSSGQYTLQVEQPYGVSFNGETISFTVGNSDAAQTLIWRQGAATELVLSAPRDGQSRLRPETNSPPSLKGGPLAQPLPPHVILGNVLVGKC